MLRKKLIRTMWQYKTQFISMIIMTMLGIGIFVAFNVEWYAIDVNTKQFFSDTGFSDYKIISPLGFSEDDVLKLEKEYDEVTRYSDLTMQVESGKESKDDKLSIVTTENPKVSGFMIESGKKYQASEEGIWLSHKYAKENNLELNDQIELSYNDQLIKLKVQGLIYAGEKLVCVQDETQIMPDYSIFGYGYVSPKVLKEIIGIEFYPQIHIITDQNKTEFNSAINKVLDNEPIILTKDENMSYAGSQGEVEEGQIMGSILPVLFLLISVLTMITTMQRIASKEQTQIGTLKALGFRNKKILIHYTFYAIIVGILSSILGLGFGYLLAYMIVNPQGAMGTYLDMPYWQLQTPSFVYIAILIIFIVLIIIGLLSVYKILKRPACQNLTPNLAEKMKPMMIEKSKLFHKLSFGVRWNLRDALRHKSRTSMSLIGVIGCVVMMLASFGIKDTMNAYLDSYYHDAMQYETKLYLNQEIEQEKIDELLEKYDATWSSSSAIKIEDQSFGLDIYDQSNKHTKFIDHNGDFVEIKDSGVYISKRIADEFNLKPGDSFTFISQDDQSVKVKVSKIISLMTKSIVMSEEYATAHEIPFKANALYTLDDQIELHDGVKSIQSKDDLIQSFDTMTEIMDMMIMMLVVVGLILSIVVLYNLGVMGYMERYREMATLKVLGFRDKKISKLLISQNLWLSFIGIIVGLPLGYMMLAVALEAMAADYELILYVSIQSYAISILLNIGVSLLVSFMVSKKNKNIDMVEALKINE